MALQWRLLDEQEVVIAIQNAKFEWILIAKNKYNWQHRQEQHELLQIPTQLNS